ncbi:NfeD family protein [Candidatus Binatia bacterium]|nr:NfeD family protein [Candidatus Binatia bacterium]
MDWWIWILAGLVLMGLELLTPGGFFVVFFGVGAVAVGVLVALGAGGPLWAQCLWFSALSVSSLVFLRSRLRQLLQGAQGHGVGVETLVGEVAVLADDLDPGAVGKAELRGTTWTVRNAGTGPLHRGQRCRVRRVDGLMLWVGAE